MNVYKLEHQYSRSHKFYGVRTTLTFHELNVLCAYLQLLHFELPRIDGAEDTIAEDNGEKLLKTIFNAESVYEEEKYSQTLDFHDNWNEYCGGRLGEYMHEIIQVARPDAYKKLLQNMIAECRDAISRYREGKFWLENPDKWRSDVESNIHRLHHLVEGDTVKPEWGWQTMGGASCTGRVYVRNDNQPDVPSPYDD
ncbi:TPA: hypothetical protein KL033_002124 [Salmonella enterica subsp. enterica serovar 4,[5],12:i:-]|nr:hypothetical protein [Salmonella enterica subsp. enterica serovar 4,[5],12:i:-]HBE0934956.1 hypothetical protein [Salmonella enterica subsp. enterica serovar 4,[5],12:i:-]HBE0953275.1 hypothetical protein [Salmonella enterica subsp. enterica serovar 4,[5],12:i:-]HBE0962468.1 hypothetical protein [Salmonella enterica subsp. enterica serovar 4,[5],12:i:-]